MALPEPARGHSIYLRRKTRRREISRLVNAPRIVASHRNRTCRYKGGMLIQRQGS